METGFLHSTTRVLNGFLIEKPYPKSTRKVEEGWRSESFREQGSGNTIANAALTVGTKVPNHKPVTIPLLLQERKYRGAEEQPGKM
jgi:hypothetical protein